uniref:Uncharacterized protein n=1 Tax=Setaria viridis TaxID=4556 RepID=A0A4U6WAP6_SETVI|nr:hypothetical protein SEVIR_2G328800v2 [Setaria viridis]
MRALLRRHALNRRCFCPTSPRLPLTDGVRVVVRVVCAVVVGSRDRPRVSPPVAVEGMAPAISRGVVAAHGFAAGGAPAGESRRPLLRARFGGRRKKLLDARARAAEREREKGEEGEKEAGRAARKRPKAQRSSRPASREKRKRKNGPWAGVGPEKRKEKEKRPTGPVRGRKGRRIPKHQKENIWNFQKDLRSSKKFLN